MSNNSPLNKIQQQAFEALLLNSTPEALNWLNGFFQGLAFKSDAISSIKTTAKPDDESDPIKLTVLYGTHTGHSEKLANSVKQKAEAKGIVSQVFPMDDYHTKQLKTETNLLVIVSTHGEGEPPDMAEDFYEFISGKRVPKLPGLNFSVLALGDKSYKFFCKTGLDIRNVLLKAGANEITPTVTCDVDYDADSEQWIKKVIHILSAQKQLFSQTTIGSSNISTDYTKQNPFLATVLDKVKITGTDSDKTVYHLALSIENSGISYLPGDSVGLVAKNPEILVNEIISTLKANDDTIVETSKGAINFKQALLSEVELTIITRDTLQKYVSIWPNSKISKILNDEKLLDNYLYGHDVLDLIQEFKSPITPQQLITILRPLPARLYSISSSQDFVEDEVHITVSLVDYETNGRRRKGCTSGYLSDKIEVDDLIPIYIEKNPAFKLPEKTTTPVIMVGAGTGIAPYRSFLQQREAEKNTAKSWLFFGERRFFSDFLYQTEWQKYLKKGLLGKIDLAFSRDQEEKVYVQHRLAENQKEVFQWLEDGANFYVCGDMKKMAKDVQQTLLQIIQVQGGMSEEKANEYLKKLKKAKRFQTDVY